ncbi:MAG: CDP-alcohol phosphatidyltransferase family protein [Gemmatimonadaceae bacterium]|nr:CDP-alcohol phosphatidyltransferase family protein [Gemmatimonadaceae bacterium]
MNLPNAVTAGRIAVTPLIAWLPLAPSTALRLAAFVLFVVAAVTDYVDGRLARSRKEETDLGRLLDPLADKLLLVATCVPMFLLMRPSSLPTDGDLTPVRRALSNLFPFHTPFGDVPITRWIIAIVLGRELFMTLFRQIAARRGIVIAAIGPAKWKMAFQSVWVGSAYFWFFAATLAAARQWDTSLWNGFAAFNGLVGVISMLGAIVLTLYSLALYLRSYGRVFTGVPVRGQS